MWTVCAIWTGGFDECRVFLSVRLGCSPGRHQRVTLEGMMALRLEQLPSKQFWHLLPGMVIEAQTYRMPPLTTEALEEKKTVRREDKKHFAKC